MTALAGWENFYVIVGSSAGALIGLQFVVLTLISQMPIRQDLSRAGAAFSTPTIVHFGTVLLLSAILNAPWHGIISAAVAWGLVGLVGIWYTFAIARHMRAQTLYQPVFEDWLCHVVLPAAAYATLASRPMRHSLMRTRHCLEWQLQPCCSCSAAFTTPGTPSPIMCSTANLHNRSPKTLGASRLQAPIE